MKIAVIACPTYYGKGMSYERAQLAASLTDLGHDVLFVPIAIYQQFSGQQFDILERFRPQLVVLVPHVNEVHPADLRGLGCPIVLLLADDDWRREHGLNMAADCDYVLGNAPDSVAAYGAKSISFEWAIYPPLFAGDTCERTHDVTFIGQHYGNRHEYMQALMRAGVNLTLVGMGQSGSTAIAPEAMADLLRQSKIGLNLSHTSQGNMRQVKIRPFEIGAAGALILTEYAPGIENSFIDGKEAIFFETIDEMVEAAQYYLAHDHARETIAKAGHNRVMCDHTLERRWEVIFKAVGVE